MAHGATACPDCAAYPARHLGRLPDTALFAGRPIATPLAGGALYRCPACHLLFRWPRLDEASALALYDDPWLAAWRDRAAARADWQQARCWIDALARPRARVLDIDCHTGGLLDSLGSGVAKFGVEPNRHARAGRAARLPGMSVAGGHCTW